MNGTWAISTIRVEGSTAPSLDVVGQGDLHVDQNGWHVDYRIGSDRPLRDQMETVESFLVNAQDLMSEGEGDLKVSLHLSWTPLEPQDGIIFTQNLIKVLARLNAFVILDTYVESD